MSTCSDTCIKPGIGSRVEHCKVCHETFSNTIAGDRHRTGSHGVKVGSDRRRCRTADEMIAAGLTLNARGIWTRERPDPRPLFDS